VVWAVDRSISHPDAPITSVEPGRSAVALTSEQSMNGEPVARLPDLVVQVLGADDEAAGQLVDRIAEEVRGQRLGLPRRMYVEAPGDAKGTLVLLGSWLLVQLADPERLRLVADIVRGWADRDRRTIRLSMGGDVVEIEGATAGQVEAALTAFLAKHGTDG
jgi:hypothetical protein